MSASSAPRTSCSRSPSASAPSIEASRSFHVQVSPSAASAGSAARPPAASNTAENSASVAVGVSFRRGRRLISTVVGTASDPASTSGGRGSACGSMSASSSLRISSSATGAGRRSRRVAGLSGAAGATDGGRDDGAAAGGRAAVAPISRTASPSISKLRRARAWNASSMAWASSTVCRA